MEKEFLTTPDTNTEDENHFLQRLSDIAGNVDNGMAIMRQAANLSEELQTKKITFADAKERLKSFYSEK